MGYAARRILVRRVPRSSWTSTCCCTSLSRLQGERHDDDDDDDDDDDKPLFLERDSSSTLQDINALKTDGM